MIVKIRQVLSPFGSHLVVTFLVVAAWLSYQGFAYTPEVAAATTPAATHLHEEPSPKSGHSCDVQNLGSLDHGVTAFGAWSDRQCRFVDGDEYVDQYRFYVTEETTVVIDLVSNDADSYLIVYRWSGSGSGRWQYWDENDDDRGVGLHSRLNVDMAQGWYRIYATTYSARDTGDYMLSIAPTNYVAAGWEGTVDGPCDDAKNGTGTGRIAGREWTTLLESAVDSKEVQELKKELAQTLFQLDNVRDVLECTNADYNDFTENPSLYPNSEGQGHGGWDIQTVNAAGMKEADVNFYSLTNGIVTLVDRTCGTIAVYDGAQTVYYMHARHVYVVEHQGVIAGITVLGIQGNRALGYAASDSNTRQHVHIEVHRGYESREDDGLDSRGCRYLHYVPGANSTTVLDGGLLSIDDLRQHHDDGTQQLQYLCRAAGRCR